MKFLARALVIAALAWMLAGAAVWALQERLVFQPTLGGNADPARLGLAYEDLRLRTADGVTLHAWYLPAVSTASTGRHVLFLHGNAGNLSGRLHTLKVLHELGHAVLIIDYRGYGLSDGTPSEEGLYRDARAAWDYLVGQRGVIAGDIVIYGRSLGGAVAARLAADTGPRGVILESSFTRLDDVARSRYPWLPTAWLLRLHFDSTASLRALSCPVLVAHSQDDEMIPYSLSRELAAIPARVSFFALHGSHNRAFRATGTPYYRHLDRFIRDGI